MEMTDILRRYQAPFKIQYASAITGAQIQAMNAVLECRTPRYGAMTLECTGCDWHSCQYHACGNRACPRCQNYDTLQWLEKQTRKLLPVEYFMVTFTLPYELRSLVRNHQKTGYSLLLDCARSTLLSFGENHKKLGGLLGMTAVLHTHTRQLEYHPHVHVIVPAVCIDRRRRHCTKLRGTYLFNAFALVKVFRARFLQALADTGLKLPADIPQKWVADCQHVGKGLPALQYLSRYLYRGVISESSILRDNGKEVTFGYVESATQTYKTRTVSGETFLWLVFQHVLPKGFRRVRDYGFLNGNAKSTLRRIQIALSVMVANIAPRSRPIYHCKACGAPLIVTAFIRPVWQSG
jgi:hypothetical protein